MEDLVVGSVALAVCLTSLAVAALTIAGLWMTFEKAGYAGWMAVVPVLNAFVLVQIAEKPEWWIVLYLLPLVNVAVAVLVTQAVAERFGRSTLFGIGLFLAPWLCYPLLGFGEDDYIPDADLD
ncbi:MAG: DUF5684 domain-containing protein [Bacteroidota bacterium]